MISNDVLIPLSSKVHIINYKYNKPYTMSTDFINTVNLK